MIIGAHSILYSKNPEADPGWRVRTVRLGEPGAGLESEFWRTETSGASGCERREWTRTSGAPKSLAARRSIASFPVQPRLSRRSAMRRRMQTQLVILAFLSALPPAFSSPSDPKRIDFVDLHLDFDALAGQSVQIEGWLSMSGGSFVFSDRSERLNPIPADDSRLSRDERYCLLSRCSDRCRATVIGLLETVQGEKVIELTRILRPKVKPRKAPAPKAAAPDGSGPRFDVIELLLDFEQWRDRQVQVHGYLVVWGLGEILLLYESKWNSSFLIVEGTKLSREEQRILLTKCNPGCSATFQGEPGQVLTQKGLIAAKLLE
jgi:hypothetical protein